jgi:hypothetical protein
MSTKGEIAFLGVYGSGRGHPSLIEESEANARLIAASPLLLAECEWMFSVIGGALDADVNLPYLSKERYEQTRTVLADARGEK